MKCEYLVLADALDERRMAIAGRVDSEPASMLTSAEWKTVAETCHTIAKECRSMGLKTVFHHHVGSFIETPEEILRLCELTDPQLLGICLDTGHYVYGGGDPLEAFDLFGSRIQYLHFKDINREALENVRREKLGFVEGVRRGVFCSLGNGCVDFPKIVKRLNQMKYHGWIVFEQDVDAGYYNGPTPLEAATESRLYIQRILEN
jgi:inosose dehydratase